MQVEIRLINAVQLSSLWQQETGTALAKLAAAIAQATICRCSGCSKWTHLRQQTLYYMMMQRQDLLEFTAVTMAALAGGFAANVQSIMQVQIAQGSPPGPG